ncbi:MAG: tRNA (N(6)-L-threonylcarbamoyladenosine(37)-C(2))-methylthiotransferase MtaB, partial [Pseudomonadota bacterium]
EEMFARSLDLVEDCGLTWLHVFPYSARPGTPAARMPAVQGGAIKERAARLRQAGEARVQAYLASQVGRPQRVLLERLDQGRTEGFAQVRLSTAGTVGQIVEVVPKEAQAQHLVA